VHETGGTGPKREGTWGRKIGAPNFVMSPCRAFRGEERSLKRTVATITGASSYDRLSFSLGPLYIDRWVGLGRGGLENQIIKKKPTLRGPALLQGFRVWDFSEYNFIYLYFQ